MSQLLSRGKKPALLFALGGLVLGLFLGCGAEPPAPWPWWTADDSASVRAAIAEWAEVMDASGFLEGSADGGWQTGLTGQDSTSETGDTLYKFANLLSFGFGPGELTHRDEYQFGVTVDTIALTDTFCEVGYRDSMVLCKAEFRYDSLWVVGFRPDTTIDTTTSPPETTVVWLVSQTELRGYSEPQLAVKDFDWRSLRKLFLPRSGGAYALSKATGFAVYVPGSEDAPSINRVIFSRPGRVDTIFYSPRNDNRGLYNLRPLDSLYTIEAGEQLDISVSTTTPADTTVDKNRFFLGVDGERWDITANARLGTGTFSLGETGTRHVYVEAVPVSNLFYPGADYVGTVWAIPVRVVDGK